MTDGGSLRVAVNDYKVGKCRGSDDQMSRLVEFMKQFRPRASVCTEEIERKNAGWKGSARYGFPTLLADSYTLMRAYLNFSNILVNEVLFSGLFFV